MKKDDDIKLKHNLYGLGSATIGLFICILWNSTMDRIRNELKFHNKILSYEKASVEDYTVRGHINKSLYRKVLRSCKEPDGLAKYLPNKNQGLATGKTGERRKMPSMYKFHTVLMKTI